MNVTLMLQQSIVSAVRKLRDGWSTTQQAPMVISRADLACRSSMARTLATAQRRTDVACVQAKKSKPLRVLRFVEGGMPRASVGRMVMSGSMADVCAELDRLAAQEIALH